MKLKTKYYTEIIHKVENFKQTYDTRTFAKLKLSYKVYQIMTYDEFLEKPYKNDAIWFSKGRIKYMKGNNPMKHFNGYKKYFINIIRDFDNDL